MGWAAWIRDGREVEPSLYAADFARLGDQIDALLEAGLPRLPLRRGRRALHSAGHDRSGRAAVDRTEDPRCGRRRRLPSDGQRPGAPLRGVRGLGGRLRHLPRRGDRRSGRGRRRGARARARRRRRVQPWHRACRRRGVRRRGRGRDGALHEHRARLLGPAVHAGRRTAGSRSSRASSTSRSRSTAAWGRTTSGPSAARVRRCSSRAAPSSPTPIRRPPTPGSAPQPDEPRSRARARGGRSRRRVSEPDGRRGRRRRRRRDRRRGRDRGPRRPARRGRRARRRRRASARAGRCS